MDTPTGQRDRDDKPEKQTIINNAIVWVGILSVYIAALATLFDKIKELHYKIVELTGFDSFLPTLLILVFPVAIIFFKDKLSRITLPRLTLPWRRKKTTYEGSSNPYIQYARKALVPILLILWLSTLSLLIIAPSSVESIENQLHLRGFTIDYDDDKRYGDEQYIVRWIGRNLWTRQSAEALGLMKQLSGSISLFIRDDVTDEDLINLANTTNLQALSLISGLITNEGLKHLAGLTNLKTLKLGIPALTDDGLQHLSALTNLQTLNLWGTQVTDEGIAQLRAEIGDQLDIIR